MRRAMSLTAAAVLIAGLVTGCQENLDYEGEPEPAAEKPSEPESTNRIGTAGNSALGGAKRSAERTVGQLEQRNQDLLREMEGGDD